MGPAYSIHTGGRDLGFKPHVHLVMTKGGLKDGEWGEIDKLPGSRLAARWRYLSQRKWLLFPLCPFWPRYPT